MLKSLKPAPSYPSYLVFVFECFFKKKKFSRDRKNESSNFLNVILENSAEKLAHETPLLGIILPTYFYTITTGFIKN